MTAGAQVRPGHMVQDARVRIGSGMLARVAHTSHPGRQWVLVGLVYQMPAWAWQLLRQLGPSMRFAAPIARPILEEGMRGGSG